MNPLTIRASDDREIIMTRAFEAPRHLVYAAYTQPDLLRSWLFGPDGWALVTCEIDLRVGGAYRYVWHHAERGVSMGAGGVYREIAPGERIVCTERFDDPWYEGEAIVRVELVERGGTTTLTSTLSYPTRQARDGVLASGMEHGVAAGYDRLDRIVASERATAVA